MLSVLIYGQMPAGVKLLLIGLINTLIDSYIFSIWYKLIYFSLPLNPAIHRMNNAPNIQCPKCKESKES